MCHAFASFRKASLAESVPASAADVLMRHLRLARRTTAEVQDLYSRPAEPPVMPAVPQNDAPRRLHPPHLQEPDLDAA
jgi:hypothetical protein